MALLIFVSFTQDIECMPLNPVENMPANLSRHGVTLDKIFGNLNEVKINGLLKEAKIEDYMKSTSNDKLESTEGSVYISPSTHHINKLIKQAKVSILFFLINEMCIRKLFCAYFSTSQHIAM